MENPYLSSGTKKFSSESHPPVDNEKRETSSGDTVTTVTNEKVQSAPPVESEKRKVSLKEMFLAMIGRDIDDANKKSENTRIVSLRGEEQSSTDREDMMPTTEELTRDLHSQPEISEEEHEEPRSFFVNPDEIPTPVSEPEVDSQRLHDTEFSAYDAQANKVQSDTQTEAIPLTPEQREAADKAVKQKGMVGSDRPVEEVLGVKPRKSINIAKGWDSFLRGIGYRVTKEDLAKEGPSIFEPIFQFFENSGPDKAPKPTVESPIKRSEFTSAPERMDTGMPGTIAQTPEEARKSGKVISIQ